LTDKQLDDGIVSRSAKRFVVGRISVKDEAIFVRDTYTFDNTFIDCLRLGSFIRFAFKNVAGNHYSIVCLRETGVKKAKRARLLSPPSGAPRRIAAGADEERS
jgi:hypothetical protein